MVVYDKIQYTRDENGTTFCINEDNNIDNELYCAVSELPNHVYFINCGATVVHGYSVSVITMKTNNLAVIQARLHLQFLLQFSSSDGCKRVNKL